MKRINAALLPLVLIAWINGLPQDEHTREEYSIVLSLTSELFDGDEDVSLVR